MSGEGGSGGGAGGGGGGEDGDAGGGSTTDLECMPVSVPTAIMAPERETPGPGEFIFCDSVLRSAVVVTDEAC
eukprot:scaffold14544_cov32-Phaeocystis_antarctica.AAC.1